MTGLYFLANPDIFSTVGILKQERKEREGQVFLNITSINITKGCKIIIRISQCTKTEVENCQLAKGCRLQRKKRAQIFPSADLGYVHTAG